MSSSTGSFPSRVLLAHSREWYGDPAVGFVAMFIDELLNECSGRVPRLAGSGRQPNRSGLAGTARSDLDDCNPRFDFSDS